MKVILKKDMQSLGDIGDIIEVSDGYARNYLLPKNIVEIATAGALKNREKNIERIKAKAEKLHQEALAKAEKIQALELIEIEAKAGESGKLFGAITTKKLAELIQEKSGIEVDRKNILLEKPINHIGEYEMKVKFTTKVSAVLNVGVKASEVIKEEIISEVENDSEE
ncbi:MAG TPA: 50S ribosomal protein L9 [Candidatus Adamsella sp.]|nr:50S ribosomal protein L9 [Candidatus Adamsella sp.]